MLVVEGGDKMSTEMTTFKSLYGNVIDTLTITELSNVRAHHYFGKHKKNSISNATLENPHSFTHHLT